MVNCYAESDILDYLKDEMNPSVIDDFERHIEECDDCATRLCRLNKKLRDELFIKRTLDLLDRLDGKID